MKREKGKVSSSTYSHAVNSIKNTADNEKEINICENHAYFSGEKRG